MFGPLRYPALYPSPKCIWADDSRKNSGKEKLSISHYRTATYTNRLCAWFALSITCMRNFLICSVLPANLGWIKGAKEIFGQRSRVIGHHKVLFQTPAASPQRTCGAGENKQDTVGKWRFWTLLQGKIFRISNCPWLCPLLLTLQNIQLITPAKASVPAAGCWPAFRGGG